MDKKTNLESISNDLKLEDIPDDLKKEIFAEGLQKLSKYKKLSKYEAQLFSNRYCYILDKEADIKKISKTNADIDKKSENITNNNYNKNISNPNDNLKNNINESINKDNLLNTNNKKVEEKILQQKKKVIEPQDMREKNLGLLLFLGVALISISGMIFATNTWHLTNDFTRCLLLWMFSGLFFGLSWIANNKLNIPKTANAFLILGTISVPITLISIGTFALIGEYLSFRGDGKFIFLTIMFLITYLIFRFSQKKTNLIFFNWSSAVCFTFIILSFTAMLKIEDNTRGLINLLILFLVNKLILLDNNAIKKIIDKDNFRYHLNVNMLIAITTLPVNFLRFILNADSIRCVLQALALFVISKICFDLSNKSKINGVISLITLSIPSVVYFTLNSNKVYSIIFMLVTFIAIYHTLKRIPRNSESMIIYHRGSVIFLICMLFNITLNFYIRPFSISTSIITLISYVLSILCISFLHKICIYKKLLNYISSILIIFSCLVLSRVILNDIGVNSYMVSTILIIAILFTAKTNKVKFFNEIYNELNVTLFISTILFIWIYSSAGLLECIISILITLILINLLLFIGIDYKIKDLLFNTYKNILYFMIILMGSVMLKLTGHLIEILKDLEHLAYFEDMSAIICVSILGILALLTYSFINRVVSYYKGMEHDLYKIFKISFKFMIFIFVWIMYILGLLIELILVSDIGNSMALTFIIKEALIIIFITVFYHAIKTSCEDKATLKRIYLNKALVSILWLNGIYILNSITLILNIKITEPVELYLLFNSIFILSIVLLLLLKVIKSNEYKNACINLSKLGFIIISIFYALLSVGDYKHGILSIIVLTMLIHFDKSSKKYLHYGYKLFMYISMIGVSLCLKPKLIIFEEEAFSIILVIVLLLTGAFAILLNKISKINTTRKDLIIAMEILLCFIGIIYINYSFECIIAYLLLMIAYIYTLMATDIKIFNNYNIFRSAIFVITSSNIITDIASYDDMTNSVVYVIGIAVISGLIMLLNKRKEDSNKEHVFERTTSFMLIFALLIGNFTITYLELVFDNYYVNLNFNLNQEFINKISLLITPIFLFILSEITDIKIKNKNISKFVSYTSIAMFMYAILINIPIPYELILIANLLPILITIIIADKKLNSKFTNNFNDLVSLLVNMLCLIDAFEKQSISSVLILGSLALIYIIYGNNEKRKKHFFAGILDIILLVLYFTMDLWTNIPWWIYTLLAGVILITLATLNELKKNGKYTPKVDKEKIKNKFKDWK